MSKFIKQFVLSSAFVYGLSWIVAIYFKLTLTRQRINSQKVNPKVLEYALIFKGYDPFMAEAVRRVYERGEWNVDDTGLIF